MEKLGDGADKNFTGGEGGDDRGTGSTVEPEGFYYGFDEVADPSDGGVGEHFGRVVTIEFRVGTRGPEQDHDTENEGPGVFQEGPAAVQNVPEDVAPLRETIRGKLEEEVGLDLVGSESTAQDAGDEKGGEGSEDIDGKKDDGLFPSALAASEQHRDEKEVDGEAG